MKALPLAAFFLATGAAIAPSIAAAQEAQAQLTINSSIETLMGNATAKAIVLKHLPGLDQHPAYGQFKSMSLVALKPWSQGQITDEIIEKVTADLAAL